MPGRRTHFVRRVSRSLRFGSGARSELGWGMGSQIDAVSGRRGVLGGRTGGPRAGSLWTFLCHLRQADINSGLVSVDRLGT